MGALNPEALITLGGVATMLAITVAMLAFSRQPARLVAIEDRVGVVTKTVDEHDHYLRNVRQVVPSQVEALARRMATLEGDIKGLREMMQRVDRRQEMMLDSQLRQEGRDRT